MGRNGRLAIILFLIVSACILGRSSSAFAQTERLTLEQCIDIALEKNLGIISKEAAAECAKDEGLDAWGGTVSNVSTDAR